ncbi:type II toxin-antitoxin system ParD family antitoxin [Rhizobium sp. RAF56]|uniref:type II toxin-antitoxin system ParD family antitoxin n=1 Tax=Rhizobium sp. RAF56 TaxID=3233062 RepID=UPI003F98F2AF
MAQHPVVPVTAQQKEMIDHLVRSGRFSGASDVIAAGLDLLKDREQRAAAFVAEMEQEVAAGLASGPTSEMETSEELLAQFRRQI